MYTRKILNVCSTKQGNIRALPTKMRFFTINAILYLDVFHFSSKLDTDDLELSNFQTVQTPSEWLDHTEKRL